MDPVRDPTMRESAIPQAPVSGDDEAIVSTPFQKPGYFGMLARRLCYALQSRLPTRHIAHQGFPYMERSYVTTVFGIRVYLHRFVACDEDGVHDHPFRHSLSFILAGWYWEDLWADRKRRRFINYIGPNKLHRVVLPYGAGADVWTLFFHTSRVKSWGILHPEGDSAGPMKFEVMSEPDDPALSRWHLTAPTGAELRAEPRRNIGASPAFNIPLGQNAYSAGLARYPESALREERDAAR